MFTFFIIYWKDAKHRNKSHFYDRVDAVCNLLPNMLQICSAARVSALENAS